MSLAPGSQLGPYEVLSLVGSGGMGEVYRAHDSRLGRDVAIKIIKDEHLRSPDALARFEREARAVAHLNHPHIARLYDRGEQRGTHFLVMEYLGGESLAVRLRRGALSLPDALRYASEMADALDHAHHAGILHRDLKPANVLLTADGVKLVDFGLAKEIVVAGATTATPLTAHGALVGTYQYMAPEQLDGRDPDARSDVFAVGAVLFEMMTGQRAFAGHTSARIAAAILHDVPVPVSQLQPLASSAIDKVVRVCLAKDPDDRWQTAAELRDRLRTIRIGTKRPPRTKAAATLPSAAEPSSSQRSAASRICGLAVLPLRDLSGDEAQNYFADGMTESLITSLAKIGALKVIARSSVMAYKASSKPLREIARELKVDAVLEGSVTRGQERVGVNLQLVRVATDSTIWAEQYNRDLTDVLEVQSEVARAVADAIKVTITPSEQLGLRAAAKVVREAHDEYLKGDFALNRQTKDGLAAAFAHFTRAIELDSGHALSPSRQIPSG